MVVVDLSDEELAEAMTLAQVTFERWKDKDGHYRNTLQSHQVGRLGELAVLRWLTERGKRPCALFRDPGNESLADILSAETYLEVKTWAESGWAEWGRCVRPAQLPSLRAKADVVVWCFTSGRRVTLAGWSTVGDIEAAPLVQTGPLGRQLTNHQVALGAVRVLPS